MHRSHAMHVSLAALLCAVPSDALGKEAAPAPAVFFVPLMGDLVPLGCYDAQKRRFDGRDACLGILPRGVNVSLGTGTSVPVTGRIKTGCNVSHEARINAVSIEGEVEDRTFAVWPESAAAKVTAAADIKDEQPPSAQDLRLLSLAVRKAARNSRLTFTLQQLISEDIDGDGKKDRLYVTRTEGKDLTVFGGLFLQRGSAPGDMDVLTWRKSEDVEDPLVLMATMDLAGDGAHELWLIENASPSSRAFSLARVFGGALKVVGKLNCSDY